VPVLQAAIEASPQDAGPHHALGLALTRLKRPTEALSEFLRAAELDPEQARYAYVYAVALHSAGRGAEAVTDRDTLQALIGFNRDAGDIPAALDYAQRLAGVAPGDRNLATLIENLKSQAKGADTP
jgi:tetratricopeptide (TPR) repeat protein